MTHPVQLKISVDRHSSDLWLELPNGTHLTIPVSERGVVALYQILEMQHNSEADTKVGTDRCPIQYRVDRFIASPKQYPLYPITKLAPRSRKLTYDITLDDLGL